MNSFANDEVDLDDNLELSLPSAISFHQNQNDQKTLLSLCDLSKWEATTIIKEESVEEEEVIEPVTLHSAAKPKQ